MSRTAVIACGALAADVRKLARNRGWSVDVHPVPALLHNRPELIPEAVAAEVDRLSDSYDRVAVAYGDCGTYGALDAVLSRAGVHRLVGQHCYDLFAREEVREALEEEPGTYFLTDFLARTFEHTVISSSDSTGTRSCATTTSATTGGSSGSRSGRRSARSWPPNGPRPRSRCRSRCARWATRAWSAHWNPCSRRRRAARGAARVPANGGIEGGRGRGCGALVSVCDTTTPHPLRMCGSRRLRRGSTGS